MGWLKRYILKQLVQHLFNVVTADDIVQERNGKVYIGRRKLEGEDVIRLSEDAERLQNSLLWSILTREVQYEAGKQLFEGGGADGEGMVIARALYYAQKVYDETLVKLQTISRRAPYTTKK